MRSESPLEKTLLNETLGTTIAYEAPSFNRDLPGNIYRFTVDRPDLRAKATVVAGDTASLSAHVAAQNVGRDVSSIDQSRVLTRDYIERHGSDFSICSFVVEPMLESDAIRRARDAFIEAFFDYASSYRNNDLDYVEGADGFYPDMISFEPYELKREFHVVARMGRRQPFSFLAKFLGIELRTYPRRAYRAAFLNGWLRGRAKRTG